ncbi:MAG: hypothetical protein QOG41_2157, partial [Thermoleophilaceae bacterium]|nr:hypothetical protein [Thermoleophilaceae bacterium]
MIVAAVMLSLAVPAPAAEAKHHSGPGLTLRIVSKRQRTILRHGQIVVRVKTKRRPSLVRLFASFRPRGRKKVPIVATRVRDFKAGRHHLRRVELRLNRAGRRAIASCARGRIVITAAPIRKKAGRPGHRVRKRGGLKRDPKRCGKKTGGKGHGGHGNGGGGGGSGGGGKPPPVDYQPSNPDRCDWIDGADCMFPFPNDFFTTADSTTTTKRRLNFNILSMPRNVEQKPIDPTPFNRNDGFSPGSAIVTHVPGLDTKAAFQKSGIVPIDDMGDAFREKQPVVVIDTKTLARHLVWAELDANPTNKSDVNLIIRPGTNLTEGRRYIVALRRLEDATGKTLQPTTGFRVYRDGNTTKSDPVEKRRPHFEEIFRTLAEAGVDREDLYRAWDFTVASERNLSERMLSIRDDAFKQLGDTNLSDLKVQGASPKFKVTGVENSANPNDNIGRTVEGTVTVPCYISTPTCAAGGRFIYPPNS